MDLKTVQTELRRLAAMAERWRQPHDIAPIERDLMLARLRDIYESVAFGLAAEAPQPAETAALPAADVAPAPVGREEPPQPAVGREPTAETSAGPASASEQEPKVFEAAPGETPAVASEQPTPVPSAPTLFGNDADPVRHRRKQRVIMSLYDTAIDPPVRPKASAKEEPATVRNSEPIDLERFAIGSVESLLADEPAVTVVPEATATSVAPAVPEAPKTPVGTTEPTIEVAKPVAAEAPQPLAEACAGMPAAECPEPSPAVAPEEALAVEPAAAEAETAESSGAVEAIEAIEDSVAVETAGGPVETPAETPAETSAEASAAAERPAPIAPSPDPVPVLGEVIAPHVQTLADTLAPQHEVAGDRLGREPIADLRHAVGINDKFLLIRDLFDGNGALYEITIRRLDEFERFDDCMIYIAEHFAWNPNSDGAKLMMELLERKFA